MMIPAFGLIIPFLACNRHCLDFTFDGMVIFNIGILIPFMGMMIPDLDIIIPFMAMQRLDLHPVKCFRIEGSDPQYNPGG